MGVEDMHVAILGRYKQWNGLLERNTGLSYVGPVSVYIIRRNLTLFKLESTILLATVNLWMTVIMTIVAYCSVFGNA